MDALLPILPLAMVAFPGERIPLHIFEARYKQLIDDCLAGNTTFGIPAYVNKTLTYGTEIVIDSVVNRYENGNADIMCHALRAFKIVDFINPMHDRLYAGAKVSWILDISDSVAHLKLQMIRLIAELYEEMNIPFDEDAHQDIKSFDLAHKIGLSLEQELTLLALSKESERVHFIVSQLKKTIPTIKNLNRTKAIIQMNGHFRNYDPLDFKEFKI
jgi:hypothetical protein